MTDIVQGTDEWRQIRCGKVTASRVGDAIARTKTGWSAKRDAYMGELLAERLTGMPVEKFPSAAMRWGTEHEAEARLAYEFYADADVMQVGFIPHPEIAMSGASPDGLIGSDGLLEIKCPTTSTHVDTLIGQAVPDEHMPQIMWQLACSDRSYCDFVSFDPRMPADMRLFVRRVHRDKNLIAKMEGEVRDFLAHIDAKVAALLTLYERKEAA